MSNDFTSVDAFIERWKPSRGSEMANFQSFAAELTDLLGVERPKPADSDGTANDYRFERPVTFTHTGRGNRGRIDLYRRGCIVMEAKQGGDRQTPRNADRLTLTQMCNLLEKLRTGETIEGKDQEIYEQGLVGILRDIHDRIDAAVAEAYGWPVDLSDEEILFRLVDLNKERAAEEPAGHIRWLRPDYQNPQGRKSEAKGKQVELAVGTAETVTKAPWPKTLPEQIARRFQPARTASVAPLLDSLAAIGQAQVTDDGRYAA